MAKLTEIFSKQEVRDRIRVLAGEIDEHYGQGTLVVVCVLKGAVFFFADLVRRLNVNTVMDFVRLSSYGKNTVSSGEVRLTKDIETDIRGKDVLIVEDIVDSGKSLERLLSELSAREPKSLKICALVDKHERRESDLEVDFYGFSLEKGFIVGCGMDCAEKFRELEGIYIIEEDDSAAGRK